jgi:hypothetical protein
MRYVWILPFILLLFFWLVLPTFTFVRFFAVACTSVNPCAPQIGAGAPFIASLAYSFAALIAIVSETKPKFGRVLSIPPASSPD